MKALDFDSPASCHNLLSRSHDTKSTFYLKVNVPLIQIPFICHRFTYNKEMAVRPKCRLLCNRCTESKFPPRKLIGHCTTNQFWFRVQVVSSNLTDFPSSGERFEFWPLLHGEWEEMGKVWSHLAFWRRGGSRTEWRRIARSSWPMRCTF